jgi:hypothetical protein
MRQHKIALNGVATPKTCTIEGCAGIHAGHGFCQKHYTRFLKHGDPLAGRTPTGSLAAFLDELVTMTATGDCVDWPYGHHPVGYGQMHVDGRLRKVTHLVLERTGHPQPAAPDNLALHSCDRPSCVAPWHLRWGSSLDNYEDAISRGRLVRGHARLHTGPALRDVS